MGLRTRRKALILEGKEERDFRWASALYTESGPAPRDASGTSTQTQNADPGWAQKIRPWPGGAGHFLPTVLSGDRQAGPRPGPPRRVVRRSSPRLRNQPPPSVRGPPLQNPLLAMTAVPAPRSLVILLQVLWLALAQIVSPVTSLVLQSPVQSLGLRILESLGPVLVRP